MRLTIVVRCYLHSIVNLSLVSMDSIHIHIASHCQPIALKVLIIVIFVITVDCKIDALHIDGRIRCINTNLDPRCGILGHLYILIVIKLKLLVRIPSIHLFLSIYG